ncbi:Multi antimicrobial extrusion protein [Salix suchowensis]|nr:Multi antimicrobial extrusion protein [Salix suchowensis]
MNSGHRFLLVFAAFSLIIPSQLSFAAEENLLWAWHHVYITNDLPGDPSKTLMVHCKDKNKDLGIKYLSQKQVFHFRAQIDLLRKNLFFCNMQWNGKQAHMDSFSAKRDENRCRKHCMWSVREDGFYFSRGNSRWDREYQW